MHRYNKPPNDVSFDLIASSDYYSPIFDFAISITLADNYPYLCR